MSLTAQLSGNSRNPANTSSVYCVRHQCVKALFDSHHPIGDKLHRKLMRDFRLYMLVGGMPTAAIPLSPYVGDCRKAVASSLIELFFTGDFYPTLQMSGRNVNVKSLFRLKQAIIDFQIFIFKHIENHFLHSCVMV